MLSSLSHGFPSSFRPRSGGLAGWLKVFIACGAISGHARAAPISFHSVETTYHAGSGEDLNEVIDGIDTGSAGWSVAPQTDRPQAAIFRCAEPVEAAQFKLSLVFLARIPNAFFQEFSVSTTNDAHPSFQSVWEPINPGWFYVIGPQIQAVGENHLQLTGNAGATVVRVDMPHQNRRVTGFRIDVFPVPLEEKPGRLTVGRGPDGDFLLTEFRVETSDQVSSNVALACPVKVSHPVEYMRPEALTDGQVATFASPKDPRLGAEFYFEIDLRSVRTLDHLVFKSRIDGRASDMLSQLRLALYEEQPTAGMKPTWQAYWRADGSYPEPGDADVIGASDGTGDFRGRYLRISSDSPRYGCPLIAEVEAYESLAVDTLRIRADGRKLEWGKTVSIPAGTRMLNFDVALPESLQLPGLPIRRRLYGDGHHEDWRMAAVGGAADWPCPPPGNYDFQVQVRHTDGEWNKAMLHLPVNVQPALWQRPSIQRAAAMALVIAGIFAFRHVSRRRLAQRVAELERREAVHKERTRIARDMHDVVGARLTQLTVMHDIFAAEHALTAAAASGLDRLKKTAREGVRALDGVVWAVNPRNDTLANLADYLCHCADEYLTPLEIECLHDVPTDWRVQPVGAQARHQLLLAFLEALQNVAKHAGASVVTLELRIEKSQFVVRLHDNGLGLPEKLGGEGKDGLANMRTRLAGIGGGFTIFSRDGGGTTVEMRLPLSSDIHL